MNDIDLPALRGLLKQTATEIAALKGVLRRTWTRPMAVEQRTLCSLKRQATGLCVLRALMRGRYHLTGADREHHQKVAEQVADRYQLKRARPCSA